MTERTLRERIIEAVGRDTAINMRVNKASALPYEIVDLSNGPPTVISAWADYDEANEQLYYAIDARRADAALSTLSSAPITEEEVEAAGFAIYAEVMGDSPAALEGDWSQLSPDIRAHLLRQGRAALTASRKWMGDQK